MPKIMDARGMMSSAVAPAQLRTQFTEDTMHLSIAKRQSTPPTSSADEERGVVRGRLAGQVARPAIATQRIDGAWVHGHLARLAELALVNAQHPDVEVDIRIA
jgi:hypothetical protein